jgi:hypothetical protein
MKLSTKQKKTVLRTVRIAEELDGILEKDAKVNRTSVNALISSIMAKYSEWDRFTERFGHVSLPKTVFRTLLDLADENALARIAEQMGVQLPNEVISFWFKKINLETVLQFISIVSQYGNLGEVEIENRGRDYTIIVHHEYGKMWSIYLKHFLDQMIRTYLKAVPEIETGENAITLRFQEA